MRLNNPALSGLVAVLALLPLPALAAHPVLPRGEPAPAPALDPVKPPSPASQPVQVTPVAAPAPDAGAPAGAIAPVLAAPAPKKPPLNPVEAVYHQRTGKHAFALHVRPGAPKPGQLIALTLEISLLHDPPDPIMGDREPLKDADVTAQFKADGPRYILHPLAAPGQYGMHVTVGEPGVHTLTVVRRSGKPGLDVAFPVGIGTPTPAPADVLAEAERTGPRTPLRPGQAKAKEARPPLALTMEQLGDRLLALDAALAASRPEPAKPMRGKHKTSAPPALVSGDLAAQAKALADLATTVKGQVPPRHEDGQLEFDRQAEALAASLHDLSQHLADPAKARSALADIERNQCAKCHVEYRFDLTDDVSGWPNVTLEAPRAQK